MNLKQIIIFLGLLTCSISIVKGQSLNQALLFSQTQSASTARAASIGGSMGALGGEFSITNINPAGLAVYRSSEWTVSPSLDFRTTKNQLMGTNNAETSIKKTGFRFNNFGIVFASQPKSKWRTSNFAIGLNRIADFRNTSYTEGRSTGSMTYMFQELATNNGQGIPAQNLDDYLAGLAFDTGAIGNYLDDNNTLQYFNDFEETPQGLTRKTHYIQQNGGIRELSFSLAGSLKNKWLIGAAIGVPFIDYTHRKFYTESDDNDEIPFFERLEFLDTVAVEGSGFNVKLGTIYWVNPKLRIGASVHTPSWYRLTETYDTSVRYAYTFEGQLNDNTNIPSVIRELKYSLATPWRLIGNAGFIIQRKGAITAEIEYTTFGSNKYKLKEATTGSSSNESARINKINNDISNQVQDALTLRLGGEFLVVPFVLRAGYNLRSSTKKEANESLQQFSLGTGYGKNQWFLDLAFIHSRYNNVSSPYHLENNFYAQKTTSLFTKNQAILTFRYRF